MDLPGNNFACDSLEDKYNETYIDIYRRVYAGAIYKHLSKAIENKQRFSKA